MATWQFDLYLVPRAKVDAVAGPEAERLTEKQFEETSWWRGADLPDDYRQRLDSTLPRGKSWSPDIEAWGDEDGNRIEVARLGGALDEIRVRIDLRNLDPAMLDSLADVAALSGGCFITEEHEIVPPSPESLLKEAQNSSAYRFVLDPGAFLDEHKPD